MQCMGNVFKGLSHLGEFLTYFYEKTPGRLLHGCVVLVQRSGQPFFLRLNPDG